MTDFTIKEGDTAAAIAATLKDDDGNAIDLTGATVRFHMAHEKSGVNKVDAAATITDAANGKVKYDWQAGDTDDPDGYDAEWEVTYSGGTVETFPSSGYNKIQVYPDKDS